MPPRLERNQAGSGWGCLRIFWISRNRARARRKMRAVVFEANPKRKPRRSMETEARRGCLIKNGRPRRARASRPR